MRLAAAAALVATLGVAACGAPTERLDVPDWWDDLTVEGHRFAIGGTATDIPDDAAATTYGKLTPWFWPAHVVELVSAVARYFREIVPETRTEREGSVCAVERIPASSATVCGGCDA